MEMQAMAELAATYVNATDRHIFLTGKAGTGKTTFLKYIIEHTYKHAIVAAPTGIAAINAGGVTLHSLLQLPFGTFLPESIPFYTTQTQLTTPQTLFRNSKFNASKRQLIQEMELLIIDEVSMLRADLLDCIDHTLQYLRKDRRAFGGVQILFIGDLMQLPPVVKEEEQSLLSAYYSSLYFFESRALKQAPPVHVELQKIFRQQDQDFIDLLNRLRSGEQTDTDIQFLNRYYNPDFSQSEDSGYIHLTTHNYKADKLNEERLFALDLEMHTFHAHLEGNFPDSMIPTTPELHLKEGAQVMFIKNDPSGEGQFFNGKIGVISSLSEAEIWVQFEDGSEVLVSQYKWENIRYILDKETGEIEESFVGSFEQFPIKLAWAVTIHKSQGLTFDKAILDLSDSFAPGQLYVALSRLTSLDGLVLSSPLPESAPAIDSRLSAFNETKADEQFLRNNLQVDQKIFIANLGSQVFDFSRLIATLTAHKNSFTKGENKSQKQKHKDWTEQLLDDTTPLKKVGAGFANQIRKLLQEDDYLSRLTDRVVKANQYFIDQLLPLSARVRTHIDNVAKTKKIKGYLKELESIEEAFIKQIRSVERITILVQSLHEGTTPSREEFHETKATQLTRTKEKQEKTKIPTAEITFGFFEEGKGIKAIAKARNLAESTIEGHLAEFVAAGRIPIDQLVKKQKVDKIMDMLSSDAVGLNEIKSLLPKNYSYGEIKLVIAHHKSLS